MANYIEDKAEYVEREWVSEREREGEERERGGRSKRRQRDKSSMLRLRPVYTA